MSFPGKEEVVGTKHFKLVFNELLHPLDFIKLPLKLNVVAHQQAHFAFGDILELLESSLHYFIQLFFNLTALPVDILELGFCYGHLIIETLLLLIQVWVHFPDELSGFIVFLCNSD